LAVGIQGNEINAYDSLRYHAIDSITSTTSDTHYPDKSGTLNFGHPLHPFTKFWTALPLTHINPLF
jgi:hypothetical protein